MKMRIENHIHIMLYHFEKSWNAAQSIRDLNELFGEEHSAKAKLKDGTHHIACLVDAFRYSFGRNTWRNAILLSFNVFEEKPRFILSDKILQEQSLLVSKQQIGENSDIFGFVVGEFEGHSSS